MSALYDTLYLHVCTSNIYRKNKKICTPSLIQYNITNYTFTLYRSSEYRKEYKINETHFCYETFFIEQLL